MIGCMSFLVADLLGPDKVRRTWGLGASQAPILGSPFLAFLLDLSVQGLNGWYQLLEEERGRSESVQVPSSVSKYESGGFGMQHSGKRTFAVSWTGRERGTTEVICLFVCLAGDAGQKC